MCSLSTFDESGVLDNLLLPVLITSFSHLQIHGAHIQAGVSTASVGKFDKRLVGEKDGEHMPAGKGQFQVYNSD